LYFNNKNGAPAPVPGSRCHDTRATTKGEKLRSSTKTGGVLYYSSILHIRLYATHTALMPCLS